MPFTSHTLAPDLQIVGNQKLRHECAGRPAAPYQVLRERYGLPSSLVDGHTDPVLISILTLVNKRAAEISIREEIPQNRRIAADDSIECSSGTILISIIHRQQPRPSHSPDLAAIIATTSRDATVLAIVVTRMRSTSSPTRRRATTAAGCPNFAAKNGRSVTIQGGGGSVRAAARAGD
jgi:hypothetical protein